MDGIVFSNPFHLYESYLFLECIWLTCCSLYVV